MGSFPRLQEFVIPLLRDALPGVEVTSWIADVDYREYPIINIRRLGGVRSRSGPFWMDNPVVEMTVYGIEGLPETEELYVQALEVLYLAHRNQTMVDSNHLAYVRETMGMTQYQSDFQDSWRVQGLIQMGIRAPREE